MCLRQEDFELAFLLLTKGADPRGISLTEGDTPLHAALHIFLDINGKPCFLSSPSLRRKLHIRTDAVLFDLFVWEKVI